MQLHDDLAIVGGGITGAALAYVCSRYTGMRSIVLYEAGTQFGGGTTHPRMHSQTLHRGDIEAWYPLAEVACVRDASAPTTAYLEQHPDPTVWRRVPTMLLAVGVGEVAALEQRFRALQRVFPGLRFLNAHDIAAVEPAVLRGRANGEPVAAVMGDAGIAVDFQRLASLFIRDALAAPVPVATRCGFRVQTIARVDDGSFVIGTATSGLAVRAVAVCAGAYGLPFAHALGLGRDYAILPVAGRFVTVNHSVLRGKVYTMQRDDVPFTAPHGDPDITDPTVTRFGPTAFAVPMFDRHRPATTIDFLRQFRRRPLRTLVAFLSVLTRGPMFRYACWSVATMLPIIGRRLFAHACRKIVPTLTHRDLSFRRRIGGTRPQLVNIVTRRMVSGEARIVGNGIVITIAPSPGASTCLWNAARDAATLCAHLGIPFDRERFDADHRLPDRPASGIERVVG